MLKVKNNFSSLEVRENFNFEYVTFSSENYPTQLTSISGRIYSLKALDYYNDVAMDGDIYFSASNPGEIKIEVLRLNNPNVQSNTIYGNKSSYAKYHPCRFILKKRIG